MSTIANFYTAQVATMTQQTGQAAGLGLVPTIGLQSGNSADFLQMLLGQIQTLDEGGTAKNLSKNDANSQQQAGQKSSSLLTPFKPVETPIEPVLQEENLHDSLVQMTNIDDLITSADIQAGIDNTKQNIEPAIRAFFDGFQRKIDSLRANIKTEIDNNNALSKQNTLSALITLGFNPSEISHISEQVRHLEQKLQRDITLEDLVSGIGGFFPVNIHPTASHTAKTPGSTKPTASSSIPSPQINNNGLASTPLNTPLPFEGTVSNTNNGLSNENPFLAEDSAALTSKPVNTKNAAQIDLSGLQQAKTAQTKTAQAQTPQAQTGTSAFTPLSIASDWFQNFFSDSEWGNLPWGQDGLAQSSTPTLYHHQLHTAHITAGLHKAGQVHPATQMVSATIQKAAQSGDTRNMTLHLDPPDLGRVDVRIEVSKDNMIKAHMIVEKPETLVLLQKDSSLLDKALGDSGLETTEDSLSFELAENELPFDKNANKDNAGSEDSKAGSDEEDLDNLLIETTMNWYVDPHSGHMRYDILV